MICHLLLAPAAAGSCSRAHACPGVNAARSLRGRRPSVALTAKRDSQEDLHVPFERNRCYGLSGRDPPRGRKASRLLLEGRSRISRPAKATWPKSGKAMRMSPRCDVPAYWPLAHLTCAGFPYSPGFPCLGSPSRAFCWSGLPALLLAALRASSCRIPWSRPPFLIMQYLGPARPPRLSGLPTPPMQRQISGL